MDEYQLIEIAKRFRVLEGYCEAADRYLKRRRAEEIEELRASLESALELCRDDMVSMQTAIRAKVKQ